MQPTNPDGGGIVRTHGGEPGGDRRNRRSTSDHGGAGRTGASREAPRGAAPRGDRAHATAGGRAARDDGPSPASATSGSRATSGGRATRDDRTAAAHPSTGRSRAATASPHAGRDRAATAQHRTQH
jgi:hypothetical protein